MTRVRRRLIAIGVVAAPLAAAIGLSDNTVELIRLAASLHDVGNIGTPGRILSKAEKLTSAEYEEVKGHTTIGARILSGTQVPLLQMAEEIALYHHERWDGSGYAQLEGEAIPISARIVAVADVFDVLTHDRPYRKRWPQEEASAEIARQSGSQFDPRIVQAFLAWRRREERPKRMMETVLGG